MKTVYLVRHGESDENLGKSLQGDASPLTDAGRAQADTVAERCTRLNATGLIASSMLRAQETAQRIAEKTGLAVETSGLFRERTFPSLVIGRFSSEPEVRELMDRWSQSMYAEAARVEDGENFDLIKERAILALSYLEAHAEDVVILVSHGFFMRVMMAVIVFGESLTGSELKKFSYAFRTKNTGITVLKHRDTPEREWEDSAGWKIHVFNDHTHLG